MPSLCSDAAAVISPMMSVTRCTRADDLLHRLARHRRPACEPDSTLSTLAPIRPLISLAASAAALREVAHLAGDDREAAALLAGARRFDRGVQREDVGLERDAVDHADDVGDLLRAGVDLVHRARRPARRRRRRGRPPRRPSAASWLAWRAESALCLTVPVSCSIERGGLLQVAGGLLGARATGPGCRWRSRRWRVLMLSVECAHLADHAAQRGLHLRRARAAARRARPCGCESSVLRQVVVGDHARRADRFVQRAGHRAGDRRQRHADADRRGWPPAGRPAACSASCSASSGLALRRAPRPRVLLQLAHRGEVGVGGRQQLVASAARRRPAGRRSSACSISWLRDVDVGLALLADRASSALPCVARRRRPRAAFWISPISAEVCFISGAKYASTSGWPAALAIAIVRLTLSCVRCEPFVGEVARALVWPSVGHARRASAELHERDRDDHQQQRQHQRRSRAPVGVPIFRLFRFMHVLVRDEALSVTVSTFSDASGARGCRRRGSARRGRRP